MKRFSIIGIFILLLGFLFVPSNVYAASVYSVDLKPIPPNNAVLGTPYSTYCVDNTCDEVEPLWAVDVDVTERLVPISVDICIYGDTDITYATATVTSTGTLYTNSYVGDNNWACGASSGTFTPTNTGTGWACGPITSDQMFCKMRIDQDTNARITINGRRNAPQTECRDFDHVSDPSHPPVANRFLQSDIFKHNDITKSGTDNFTQKTSCIDGNVDNSGTSLNNPYRTHTGSVNFNGSSPSRFKPTATPVKFYIISIHDYSNNGPNPFDIAGPLTYSYTLKLPSYITLTSCVVSGTFPHSTPTCAIWASGKNISFTVDEGGNISNTGFIDLYGTITAPTGCPYAGTQTKTLFTDMFVNRNEDESWNIWGPQTSIFGCS